MQQFSDFLNKYKNNQKKKDLILFGAGTIGRLTFGALKEKNIQIDYFCDSDARKQNNIIENTKVISPYDLNKFDKNNTDIFVSANYFGAIVPELVGKGFKNIYINLI